RREPAVPRVRVRVVADGVQARVGLDGQAQGERRALAGLGPHGDLAAVVGGDVLDDAQAEPGATRVARARRVDAVAALEQARPRLGRDADALVDDGDLDHPAPGT